MSTTRTDENRIAGELRDARPAHEDTQAYAGWRMATKAVANALHITSGYTEMGNRKFDRTRFLADAGVEVMPD